MKTKKKRKNKNVTTFKNPTINKFLTSTNLDINNKYVNICKNNIPHILVNNECIRFDNEYAKHILRQNIKNLNIVNCNNIIAPKQLLGNCWFNTLFMNIFISDGGRKFTKFFRQLMIDGKDANGNIIPKNLHIAFFKLNRGIDACLNSDNIRLYHNDMKLFNTNHIIKDIYNIIKNKNIPNINDAGNPIDYFITLLSYLNNKSINILRLQDHLFNRNNWNSVLMYYFTNLTNKPNIIILELYDTEKSKFLKKKAKYLDFGKFKYKLDSSIILDKSKEHFCSNITCNKKEYKFDGASLSGINEFKWKHLINKDHDWGFKYPNKNAQYRDLKWNYKDSYQILFYYRIK